jgi:hypothetical protein
MKAAWLISLAVSFGTTPIAAKPTHLRCTNLSSLDPAQNYSIVTIDLDSYTSIMINIYVINAVPGTSTIPFKITQFDDKTVTAVSDFQDVDRQLSIDRLSGRIRVKMTSRSGPYTRTIEVLLDCQPAKPVF